MHSFTATDLHNSLPDVESTISLSGLVNSVSVHRDTWGIPHIKAGTAADLFFAQGFVTAQDRLWHMDYDRHRALGRWAEWVGADGVEADRLLRAAGMGRTAKLDYDLCSDAAREMIDAYTAGVNAFIDTTQALPIEYSILGVVPEPWESWHCLTVYKMRNTLLGTYEGKLFRSRLAASGAAEAFAKVVKGYPRGHLLTVPPGTEFEGQQLEGLEELQKLALEANELGQESVGDTQLWKSLHEADSGSNAWSISGEFTASGLPLVGGDSHRALDTPSVYYQVHLSCPEFSAIGSSVPGMPGVLHFCHNEHVAWGMTYGAADTQDLFLERFRQRPDGGREYAFDGAWKKAEVLKERIEINGGDDLLMEVTLTHHGPVIAGDPAGGWGIAISDPGLIEGTPWPDAALEAMSCRSVDGLHLAFAKWTDRVNNYAVADVDGNFGYLHEGRIPVRGEANGWRAVAGWKTEGDYEWKGYIPHDELPKTINPECGYAVTCNQRVADEAYPYYVGLTFYAGFRARRVQKRILELQRGATVPIDLARIHGDRISTPAQIFTEALVAAGPDVSGVATEALAMLVDWDYSMDRDLVQPTIYSELRKQMTAAVAANVFGDNAAELLESDSGGSGHERLIGLEIMLALESGEAESADLLPPGATWGDVLRSSFEAALGSLQDRLGDDVNEWAWREIHHTRPRHPLSTWLAPELAAQLDPPSLAVHGDGDTPLASGFTHNTYVASTVSVNRYIHDPADWSRSRWIVPLGASGHAASPHYADQARMWSDVEYIPQLWDWSEIEAQAETSQNLEPGS
jgi:penicillin amidase